MRTLFAVLSLALPAAVAGGVQEPAVPPAFLAAHSATPPPVAQGRPTAQTPVPQPPVVMGTQQTPAGGVPTRPPNAPTPTAPAAPQPPRPDGPSNPAVAANIRLDLTITDTLTGAPVAKSLTMHIMSGASGSIRSISPMNRGNLDVDAAVRVFQNTMVTTTLTFSYSAVAPPSATPTPVPSSLQESITVLLQDGKPLIVSQSADPGSDRKVSVELKATIVPIAR